MKRASAAAPATDWTERSRDLGQLLARTALGDRAAFATLYERSSPHLFAVVLRITRDRAQAEDILQEVYVNVWRAARSFDAAQSQPLTWLTSIARNRAIEVSQVRGWLCAASKLRAARQTLTYTSCRMSSA